MTGWALCGHEAPAANALSSESEEEQVLPENRLENQNLSDWRPHHTLRRSTRISIGRQCKRIIDYARVEWLRQNGFEVDDVIYCAPEVSGENRLLMAKPIVAQSGNKIIN